MIARSAVAGWRDGLSQRKPRDGRGARFPVGFSRAISMRIHPEELPQSIAHAKEIAELIEKTISSLNKLSIFRSSDSD
jgi:hypothetical protein